MNSTIDSGDPVDLMSVEQLDEGVWLKRPLTSKILDAATRNVPHLCRLRCVLMEKLMAGMGLYSGMNFQLRCVRDLSNNDYDRQKVMRCWFFSITCIA